MPSRKTCQPKKSACSLESLPKRSGIFPDHHEPVIQGQTRTSSLGAARPLPPSADIGLGGQSAGQAAQLCLADRHWMPVVLSDDDTSSYKKINLQDLRPAEWRTANEKMPSLPLP